MIKLYFYDYYFILMEWITVEIEHEVLDIEDLFLQGKDKKTQIIITIEGRGDFKAYVTPVTYGQIKGLRTTDETEIADYVLQNHFFKSDETTFTVEELDILPVGVLKEVVQTIMALSGLNISEDDVKTF